MTKIAQYDWSKLKPETPDLATPLFKRKRTTSSVKQKPYRQYFPIVIKDHKQNVTHRFHQYAYTQAEANKLALRWTIKSLRHDQLEIL